MEQTFIFHSGIVVSLTCTALLLKIFTFTLHKVTFLKVIRLTQKPAWYFPISCQTQKNNLLVYGFYSFQFK